MAICVKRTDKLLFTEGITAHFIASLELFEGGDVDFLLAGVITFCRLIASIFNERRGSTFTRCAFCTGDGVEQPTSTISAIAGKKAFIIIKLPSGLQVSLIIYIGIVADILRISLSLYKL